jgi:hypothetical protein
MSDRHDAVTLETIQRLISETQASIGRQEKLITELKRDGHPAIGATTLLRLLENDLANYHKELDSLRSPP